MTWTDELDRLITDVDVPAGELADVRRRGSRRRAGRGAGVVLAALLLVLVAAQVARPERPPVVGSVDAVEGRVLPVPPPGAVVPHHVNGRPVFVVNDPPGDIRVIDAYIPHNPVDKVAAWCQRGGIFEDLAHGSSFDSEGTYRGGPSPTGLPQYEVTIDGDTLRVGALLPAPPRPGPFAEDAEGDLAFRDQEPDRVFPLRDQAAGAVASCEYSLPNAEFVAPIVTDLPETSIVTHVSDPRSGVFDPTLRYPTPRGQMVFAERLGPIAFEVLAVGVTNDPTLSAHFADDQTSLDLALTMFSAFTPTGDPVIPSDAFAMVLPVEAPTVCVLPESVVRVDAVRLTPPDDPGLAYDQLIVTLTEDRGGQVCGGADDPRRLFVIAVDRDDIDSLARLDVVARLAP